MREKMVNKWFQTWNRPEYKEWATVSKKGYLLVIIHKEVKRYLCVKAELIMGKTGLPGFKVLEEGRFLIKSKAEKRISEWKQEIFKV